MHRTRERQHEPLESQVRETLVMIALAFGLAMAVRATVAQAYEIPSESMEPAIMTDDRVFAEKLSVHFRTPEYGDVVVIDDPTGGPIPFVKRVIALEGQSVDVRDGSVWVDGVRLDEPYTHGLPSEPDHVTLPLTVPPDHLWVMGDNRTRSKDSRYFGPVPVSSIRARALAVYWPFEHIGGLTPAED